MGIAEIALTLGPVLGFTAGVGLVRRGRTQTGVAVALVFTSVTVVAAFLDNTRPIVSLFAWVMLTAAFIAGENRRRVLAISCFSVAFLVPIIAAYALR
jgi:hypothetical protein